MSRITKTAKSITVKDPIEMLQVVEEAGYRIFGNLRLIEEITITEEHEEIIATKAN